MLLICCCCRSEWRHHWQMTFHRTCMFLLLVYNSAVSLLIKLSAHRNETETKQLSETVLFQFHFVVRTVLSIAD